MIDSIIVIPSSWTPHHRVDDDELIGYLKPVGDDKVVPVTVFGYPLAEAGDEFDAERVLESHGLSYLADIWTLRVPEGEVRVVINEASPDRLVVGLKDFSGLVGAPIGHRYVLDVPVDPDRLRR